MHQTISLALAIRKGEWKYLDHAGSGGNNYNQGKLKELNTQPDLAPGAPGQLYNLKNDPGETSNLYYRHLELVRELKNQLDACRESGRSVPTR